MTRLTKILSFSVPPGLADELRQIAQEEQRTNSELFREMLRVYRAYRKKQPEPAIDEAWAIQIVQEALDEERRNPMTDEEFLREQKKLQDYGKKQAEKLGIKEEDVDRLVYESRQSRKHRQSA